MGTLEPLLGIKKVKDYLLLLKSVNYLERELGDEFTRVTSNWYSLNCYLRKQAPDAQNQKRNSVLSRGEEWKKKQSRSAGILLC